MKLCHNLQGNLSCVVTMSKGSAVRYHLSPRSWPGLIFCVCVILSACGKTERDAKKERPPIPVQAVEVVQGDAAVFLEAIGNVAALNTVDVKSRVTGELTKSFFKAGDLLEKDQRLFTIDPAPYQAKVHESEARLRQSRVQYEQARRDFARFKQLHAEKAVSQEQLETKEVDMYSKLHQTELNQAELESAQLNLGYCFINSPLEGPSGEILVDNYNIVTANQDRLVTIRQVRPIKVKFSVPGKYLDQIRTYRGQGPLSVEALVMGSETPEAGALTLIDNVINLKTGMIMLEGTFPNPETRLWPGQFVKVRLNLSVTHNAVLVLDQAVNEGPAGSYVWLIQPDHTVAMRPIKVGRKEGNRHVVTEGLTPGERVVTEGQLLLFPGARVITREQMEKAKERKAAEGPGEKTGAKKREGGEPKP